MTRSNNHSQQPGERAISHAFRPSALRLLVAAIQIGSLGLAATGMAHAQPAVPAAASQQQQAMYELDIPAQPLASAIARFSSQTGADLFSDGVGLGGLSSSAVTGRYTLADGLQQLLAGTGLGFRYQAQSSNSRPTIQLVAQGQALELAPINVQGTRIASSDGDWVYQEPRSVSVITREQIDKRPPRHAADMLEQTSGVYSSVSQQDPSLSVNIRGIQDFGRVNMNVDGVRQNYQKTGYGQRNGQMYIDPDLLSGVTIDKGATNVMGAAGTLAGVATFSTVNASDFLSDEKHTGGRVRLGGGDNGTNFIGSGIFAAGNDTFDMLLGVSRRSFGDYRSGSHGDIGNWSRVETGEGIVDGYETVFADAIKGGKISHSGYRMESYLTKLGWNLPDNQRLQLGYMRSETDTANAGVLTTVSDSGNALEQVLGWKNPSNSDITSQQISLDYSIKPDNRGWLDLKAKLYYADTENETRYHGEPHILPWLAVAPYNDETRVKTYGFQLQNTSQLWLLGRHGLVADYGAEIYHDEVKSSSTDSNSLTAGVTPEGERTLASLFANFNYSHADWLEVQAGLRYDRYRLNGETGMGISVVNPIYTEENPCTESRVSRCPNFIIDDRLHWGIDEEKGRFSPTFFVGVKPGLDWLQLFASYGKSWRPPAVTETFANGSARAGDYTIYPNPLLDAERSRSWELGFNIVKAGLLTAEDRLGVKVAYFNTSVEGYTSLAANLIKPGYGQIQVGNAAFMNNLKDSRFRGIEYLLSYDAGFAYGVANFTQMLGRNEYCYNYAWLGDRQTYNAESGNYYGIPLGSGVSTCANDALFSSNSFLPGARGSVTLGGRAFNRKLDMGVTMRFAPGYQDKSISSNTPYQADWPKYQVYDLYASYSVTSSLMLRGAVENIADDVYLVSYGEFMGYTPARGRTVQASLEYSF